MAASNRATQFTRLHKVLKKQKFRVVVPDPDRPVLEHLLFAACLENSSYEAAEEAFAALEHNFFDWNEIRVTTIRELSEVMSGLSDPRAAAQRLRATLQSVFEATYSFDLEGMRKQNLGPAVEQLEKFEGTTPFMVSYVVQAALGGHSIPLDQGALTALETVSLITPKNVEACTIPGLERAISKAKGVEFSSLLHQLGAMFIANPYAPATHKVLLEINPDAKDRLPKRRAKKTLAKKPPTDGAGRKKKAAKKSTAREKKGATKKADGPSKKTAKSSGTKKTTITPKKKSAKSPSSTKKAAAKKRTAKKPAKKAAKTKSTTAKKKENATGISKRKPR